MNPSFAYMWEGGFHMNKILQLLEEIDDDDEILNSISFELYKELEEFFH
jgi:hypothetical protein